MACGGGGETASPAEGDPLGFSVDAHTGAVTGTPQKVRDGYTMRLRAVDASGVRSDVAAWQFDVSPSAEFSLSHAAWAMETDGKLASKYHVGETHLLPKPRLATRDLLQHPAGDDYGKVVYLLSAEPVRMGHASASSCTPRAGNTGAKNTTQPVSALTDVETGEGAINIQCAGNYSATLVVRSDHHLVKKSHHPCTRPLMSRMCPVFEGHPNR